MGSIPKKVVGSIPEILIDLFDSCKYVTYNFDGEFSTDNTPLDVMLSIGLYCITVGFSCLLIRCSC